MKNMPGRLSRWKATFRTSSIYGMQQGLAVDTEIVEHLAATLDSISCSDESPSTIALLNLTSMEGPDGAWGNRVR